MARSKTLQASDIPFIHLRVKSSYSLLEGAITPKDIIKLCKDCKMPAVAISDRNNLFGSLEFSLAASSGGVQPIIGSCFSFDYQSVYQLEKSNSAVSKNHKPAVYDVLPLIAKDEEGYSNLLALTSIAFTKNTLDGSTAHIKAEQLKQYSKGIIALTGGVEGSFGRLLSENQDNQAQEFLFYLKDIFGDRLYIELMRHGLEKEVFIEPKQIKLAYDHQVPLVATNDIYFAEKKIYEAHDALLCIAEGRYLVEDDRRKVCRENYFRSPAEMVDIFSDIPEAIENTVNIAKRCHVLSPTRDPILPHYETDGGRSEEEEFVHLSKKGLTKRLERQVYPQIASHMMFEDKNYSVENLTDVQKQDIAAIYEERLQYELDIILKMKFPGYFLIVSDFIRWSKGADIPVGPGRGSGAGSLVAWSLEITDLDPLRFGLLFERFLNPERVSMPDFDVDFCQYRRDEVIKYVQQKYGYDKVAQIITFGKLQARAVLRDVGRVMQISYNQVDRICKLVPNNPASPVTLQEAIDIEPDLRRESNADPQVKKLIDVGLQLEGLNRHASTHAAGVVIGDRELSQLVPLYRDPRSDMPVTQYSMKYAESAGLVKFDFLGLKTLTVVKQACDLINHNTHQIDIETIPLDDQKTFQMLAKGDAIGVFQLESTGMRDTLRKMQADRLEDLIALISLYRPGPMDNIPTYIACKKGEQEPDYLHPLIADILKETYGVIIYQEQVMQIAQVLSGYSLGGADLLRRAMGKKIKQEMDKQREIFVEGAVKNDVDADQADGIFDLVAKFAGYGFNKSHAAAYGLISYQTAYLKANYPVEFLVANMNLDIHDTDKLYVFIRQAKDANITILPPDINKSGHYFTIEQDTETKEYHIRYALGALKNVGTVAMESLVAERQENGVFNTIFDLLERLDSKVINKRQIESLVKAGAFDILYPNRNELFENVETLIRYNGTVMREKESNQVSLFGDSIPADSTRPVLKTIEDWGREQRLNYEYESIGFFLSAHPLDGYKEFLASKNVISSIDITAQEEGVTNIKLAGIVINKRIRNSNRGKYAFIQLSDSYGTYEVSIFDEDLIQKNMDLLSGNDPLLLTATLRKDDEGIRLLATSINPLVNETKEMAIDLTLHLKDIDDHHVQKLSAFLLERKGGRSSIGIELIIDTDQKVEIKLPDTYMLSFQDVEELKKYELVADLVS